MSEIIEIIDKLLKLDIQPVCGCTEPAAIAYASFKAAKVLQLEKENLEKIEIIVSTNLFKNAVEVGIPGTNGMRGIELASAIGACIPTFVEDTLNLLIYTNDEILNKALSIVKANKIKLVIDQSRHGLHIVCKITDKFGNSARVIISGSHDNIVEITKGNEVIFKKDTEPNIKTNISHSSVLEYRYRITQFKISDIIEVLPHLPKKTFDFLLEGVEMNKKIAQAGMTSEGKLQIGKAYKSMIEIGDLKDDLLTKIKLVTSSAIDARMSGCLLPVMTSAGSGNQGIMITLPLYTIAEELQIPKSKLAESLALANVITSILKHYTGTLSAMCGCVVCAGTGLAAAITYMLGGNINTIKSAINNVAGGITGIICDGAKLGCAVKLIVGLDAAYQSAMLAFNGVEIPPSNGVIGYSIEQSLKNIGLVAYPGMIYTDSQILEIMINKPLEQ